MPMATPAPSPPRRALLPAALFLVCLAYSVWALSVGWHHSIIDMMGFRQTHTALSTYFMVGQPPRLDYETPVIGPPWAIPFEFPVYQWLVAGLCTLLNTPLDETGRFVSAVFFYLTLLPAERILARFGLPRGHRLLALALFVANPFYIFYARCFLIESTALFFSMWYLATALWALAEPRPMPIAGAAVLGVLAALVKGTTFAIFVLAVLLFLTGDLVRRRRELNLKSWCTAAAFAVLLIALPLGVGALWTEYADRQKELHPIAQRLTAKALAEAGWYFGPWSQRLALPTWADIFGRTSTTLGHWLVLAPCLIAVALMRRYRLAVAGCLLVFLAGPLVFTNQYYIHEYYSYANHIALLCIVVLVLEALSQRGGAFRVVAGAGFAAFLALGVYRYFDYFYPIQAHDYQDVAAVSQTVRETTDPDDVILIIGRDWASDVPYYSRRRALMIPVWKHPSLDRLPEYLDAVRPYRVGALVICHLYAKDTPASVESAFRKLGLSVRHHAADENFDVYVLQEPP